MLKARWSGFEIDSSEAAYEVEVPQPEQVGTLVRALLGSGYFQRSFRLQSKEQMVRTRDHILKQERPRDEMEAKALEELNILIGKFGAKRYTSIGLRPIEAILNYVGAYRQELLQAKVFHFELTEEEREYFEDMGYEYEEGSMIDETDFYSEDEIPMEGVVMVLGCALVGLNKLSPEDREKAKRSLRGSVKEMGVFERDFIREMGGWERIYQEDFLYPQDVSLRVRLNPDATFTITGRWFDDGQFAYGYYEYLLHKAAEKARAKMKIRTIY